MSTSTRDQQNKKIGQHNTSNIHHLKSHDHGKSSTSNNLICYICMKCEVQVLTSYSLRTCLGAVRQVSELLKTNLTGRGRTITRQVPGQSTPLLSTGQQVRTPDSLVWQPSSSDATLFAAAAYHADDLAFRLVTVAVSPRSTISFDPAGRSPSLLQSPVAVALAGRPSSSRV